MFDLETATKKHSAQSTLRLLGMSGIRGLHAATFIGRTLKALSVIVMLVLASSALKANAQLSTAQIHGTIADQTGAIIPGAQVVATQTATGVVTKATANDQGAFAFPSLAVGSYTLDVSNTGFRAYRQTNLVLTVGQELTVNVGLQVGASDQVVEVTASSVSVDSTSPTQQSTINEKIVQDLPLNGRNPATLTFTVAGVTDSTLNIPPTDRSNQVKEQDAANPQESAPSVHGARPGGTYFSLDGASNTDPFSVVGAPFPNPDATGEFSVVTGTYGARYVSAPGGAINIVTKAGTNTIHGAVFEFIRNGYFNARNDLSNAPDVLKRNQFGFALGGPIKKDHLFFFGSYQATPTHNNQTTTGYFPTAAQRTGNFGTFQIPAALISPAIQKLLPFIPLGDPTTGFLSYQVPQLSNDQQGVIKVDLTKGKHQDFARVFYDRFTSSAVNSTGAGLLVAAHSGFIQPWESGALGDTWTLGKFILNTRLSFSRALSTQVPATDPAPFSALGINNLTSSSYNPGFDVIQVVGSFNTLVGEKTQFPRKELEFSEDVFFTKGNHQLSFGANYRRISLNEANTAGQSPDALFYGVNSYILGLQGILPGAGVNPTADFIMGLPYVYVQGDGVYPNANGNLSGFYAEDNIRLSKKLTATAGLRWDPFLPYTVENGRISCYRPGTQSTVFPNAFPGELFAGDPGCSSGGMPRSLAEFQPRVGLAYQLDDSGKSVIRAGFGRYDLQFPLDSYLGFSNQPFVRRQIIFQPFINIQNVWGTIINPATGLPGTPNPFAAGFQGANYVPPKTASFTQGLETSSFDQNFHPAYVEQWSLSLQRLLTAKDSIDIAYNGTAGVHLAITYDLNTPVVAGKVQPHPNANFSQIASLTDNGTSSYNGVDVTYRHQSAVYSINSAFTWSKAIDDNTKPAASDTPVLPNVNHNFRRARSDDDQNFTWRTTGTYTTPKLQAMPSFVRTTAGAWTVAGLLAIDAGQPFSVTDSSNFSGSGLMNVDLADRVPGVPVYVNGKLNAAAFKDNAAGTFGNSGRNAYRGPAYKDLDLALIKPFPIHERFIGTFRAESFNLFNHPNFYPPASAYGDPGTQAASAFGTYTTARDPRILQFSLKLSF